MSPCHPLTLSLIAGKDPMLRRPFVAALLAIAGCHTPGTYSCSPPALPALLRDDVALDVPPRTDTQDLIGKPCPGCGGTVITVDPAPADGRPALVTLPQAIHEAIFHNLRVKAGTETIQQA